MSVTETLAFIYIGSQADTRTGVWAGSAGALHVELGISERSARDVLEKMEQGGYIRRFSSPGSHACYPILVHKFPITSGEHNGEQLNAMDSKSPTVLAYSPREHDGEQNGEHGAAQKRIENRKQKREKKNPAAKPTPPADPRFQPFLDFAYEAFRTKNRIPPTWDDKEGANLKRFLLKQHHITAEEWQCRFANYLDSTDAFIWKQGHSLIYFMAHFDVFRAGPVLDRSQPNKSQGKGHRTNSPAVQPEPGKYDCVNLHRMQT
jgi:hypothetical protein